MPCTAGQRWPASSRSLQNCLPPPSDPPVFPSIFFSAGCALSRRDGDGREGSPRESPVHVIRRHRAFPKIRGLGPPCVFGSRIGFTWFLSVMVAGCLVYFGCGPLVLRGVWSAAGGVAVWFAVLCARGIRNRDLGFDVRFAASPAWPCLQSWGWRLAVASLGRQQACSLGSSG